MTEPVDRLTDALRAEWHRRYPALPLLDAALDDEDTIISPGDGTEDDPPEYLHSFALHMCPAIDEDMKNGRFPEPQVWEL